ncbi:hypothetical protein ON010_g2882 [Phytophthora cinnamomi]|nr:hypothetical protein ON010_g2882 [Phytophthora cinnamomi]
MAEEARMRVELKESVQRTYSRAINLRPKNTVRAYSKRQEEFLDWCRSKGSSFNELTRFTVTGEKLHLFLEECVIGRVKRHKGSKNTSERKTTIGRSSVNAYVAAMVDLWKQQARANINSNPSPRDDAVTALLKLTQFEEDDRKRKNFADRGRDSGKRLRNLLAFLLSHYALMRGESARMLELADLHSILLENEGYSPCRALVMVMRQGKTNQVGRIEFGACMRSKYVEICPHGLLGFYLFWRWHIDGEPFPDFTSSESWYPTKLLKTGKDTTKAMSYKTHNEAITAALKFVGVHSTAKTHVGRGSGSRMADVAGASESQIRRLGRWNNQAMQKCYLTSLPREAMRTLAGFDAARRQVFPQVEGWQEAINTGAAEQSIASGGFLELLQYLRKVVLQDAVLLQDIVPNHPIWKHSIFASQQFKIFKQKAKQHLSTLEDPAEQRLQKAVPVLNAKIDGVHNDLKSAICQARSTLEAVEGSLTDVLKVLAPLQEGKAILQVQILSGDQPSAQLATPVQAASVSPLTQRSSNERQQYKMRGGLETVQQLWNEWSLGIDGDVAVRDLESQYGTKWCDSEERRFFNRRRRVLDLVIAVANTVQSSSSIPEQVAIQISVAAIEKCRRSRKKSLNWVSQNAEMIKDEVEADAIACL